MYLIQASELEKFANLVAEEAIKRVLGVVNNGFDGVVDDIGKKIIDVSDNHFSVKEASIFFKHTERTMYNWNKKKKLIFNMVGGRLYCSKEEAYKLLDNK
ncbi:MULTISPECIES: hypothetical protein [unclassified Empedobacter]|uniref:hypothetical protein n=1 Tax=unclassified Empedobacter TaxID=2643773 RepID=UPI002446B60E|nr:MULTISPECIES: hypothetical protein [unclassified Empedobacter]MDH0675142.1 hypothetical protein [Empedobacter sp. GD03861]